MDGTLCYGPRKYIDKIMGQYENMFGCKPLENTSHLEKGNHPEVVCSDELVVNGIKRYQTRIGCTMYGNVHELFTTDSTGPIENCVSTATYIDANLYHDILTDRSVI
jgi:hypothetical protein